ncbi:MAG TPA: helix-turn-helix domain-containing protein [Nocardioidaceae bacterium]
MPEILRRRADISKIAAVHHPLRRRLLELLGVHGPATASRLAAETDQLVGNVSHHLKMLSKAGLIEEAPELARDRRERWWRQVPMSLSWSVADMAGNTEDELIAEAAEHQNLSHHVDKVHQWFERRGSYDAEWSRAAYSTDSWLRLTADELVELSEKLGDLVSDFAQTVDVDDGQDRQHVFFFAHAIPAKP